MRHVRFTAILAILWLSSGATACSDRPAAPGSGAGAGAETSRETEGAEPMGSTAAAAAEDDGMCAPGEAEAAEAYAPLAELYAMDARTPVPLQPMMAWHQKQNMNDHLVAIQRITDGLSREDWEEVARGAAMIESSPQMQQMCEHMGMGAEGFTEAALEFHRRADQIAPAAQAQDVAGVLSATATTLQACNSCHATYRQEVVDAATWTSRTGAMHDPAGHGMMGHGQ